MADTFDDISNRGSDLLRQAASLFQNADRPTQDLVKAFFQTLLPFIQLTRDLHKEVAHIKRFVSIRGNQITLKVGRAEVTLQMDGKVTIKGDDVILDCTKQLDLNGGNIRVVGARTFTMNCGGDSFVHGGGTLAVRGDSTLRLESKGVVSVNGVPVGPAQAAGPRRAGP